MNNTSDFNQLPITVEPDTVQSVSAFFAMLKENTVKALSLSKMITVTFPPYEETGKALYEETATVTFRLPEFITTESGEHEISLLFDFDKLTAHARDI